jgi:hypothetical protein
MSNSRMNGLIRKNPFIHFKEKKAFINLDQEGTPTYKISRTRLKT